MALMIIKPSAETRKVDDGDESIRGVTYDMKQSLCSRTSHTDHDLTNNRTSWTGVPIQEPFSKSFDAHEFYSPIAAIIPDNL
jgi:hypothetical protein